MSHPKQLQDICRFASLMPLSSSTGFSGHQNPQALKSPDPKPQALNNKPEAGNVPPAGTSDCPEEPIRDVAWKPWDGLGDVLAHGPRERVRCLRTTKEPLQDRFSKAAHLSWPCDFQHVRVESRLQVRSGQARGLSAPPRPQKRFPSGLGAVGSTLFSYILTLVQM